ncbi:MAG: hypothetical protein CL833_12120 [Crocinitomicaceae bacterium]|nr:hypothetical protein [Crocinitomicaceae bacterium]
MGDEPSGGGGNGGATTSSFQRTVARAEDKEKKRKQEEAMMRMAESEDDAGYYARSSSGNIVRSSSGAAVTSRAGRQAQENIRAGFEGRTARDMDAEFPVDTESGESAASGSSATEVIQKTSTPASRAARRLLAQSQKGSSMRQFYN